MDFRDDGVLNSSSIAAALNQRDETKRRDGNQAKSAAAGAQQRKGDRSSKGG